MFKKAPIAFFAYKRPEHTRRSLESLAQNEEAEESELFIFCDASKRQEDQEGVSQVREVVKSQQWCGKVHIIERENNMGCAKSIISGVTEICEKFGSVIVVEDDLVVSPFFLDYMNTALNLYEHSCVMQISGHMFPVKLDVATDAVLLPFTTSWGWATWQRAWKHFEPQMLGYEKLKSNKLLRYEFELNGSYPYFKMLEAQINKKIDSWAICWYLSTFMLKGLTLHPAHSLVSNIGVDGSGTHCGSRLAEFETTILNKKIACFPEVLGENRKATNAIIAYFNSIYRHPKLSLRALATCFRGNK